MLTSPDKISKGLCRKCPLLILVVTLVLLVGAAQGSCQQRTAKGESSTESGAIGMGGASSRADFEAYMSRYWDDVDIDTLSADVREQRIVDYVYLTLNADAELRRQCWRRLAEVFDEQQPNRTVVDYLGEADSPLYSPEMLEEYLATLTTMFEDGSWQRMRVDYLLDGIRKNRVGSVIADLDVVDTVSGERTTLHEVIASGSSSEVSVLFYDPECEECATLIDRIATTSDRVIAVSVTGVALPSTGQGGAKTLPARWVSCVAADEEQLDENFYLPSLPKVYTVEESGRILAGGL